MDDVRSGEYPNESESYGMPKEAKVEMKKAGKSE
jgi:hypothetical protein